MRRFESILRAVAVGALVAAALAVPACGMDAAMNASGDFGATQGGVQDMGFARELVANGQVPPPEAFTVEGAFSEHDLPLAGPPCTDTLCLRGAIGIAPHLIQGDDELSSAWLLVGMSSTIDPATFKRPSLTIVATVDVSGSMGWNYSSPEGAYPSGGALSRELLHRIARELGPRDMLAIVTYGSDVSTPLDLTDAGEQSTIHDAINELSEGGSTNMEAGLTRAYNVARIAKRMGLTDQVRVMLFTDVQPNVGATSPTEFQEIAAAGAGEDIGLTVFAVGVGIGPDVLNAMVNMRGGNAFSLFDDDDPATLMEDNWPWLVSPLAYDLHVALTPSPGLSVAAAYGFPGHDATSAGLDVATVFLSKRRGGLLLQLDAATADALATAAIDGTLTYVTPSGNAHASAIGVAYAGEPLDERGTYFAQPSVGTAVALAVMVSSMQEAATLYASEHAAAVALMETIVARISADAAALGDPSLPPEAVLAAALLALMREDAPQGTLYGQY